MCFSTTIIMLMTFWLLLCGRCFSLCPLLSSDILFSPSLSLGGFSFSSQSFPARPSPSYIITAKLSWAPTLGGWLHYQAGIKWFVEYSRWQLSDLTWRQSEDFFSNPTCLWFRPVGANQTRENGDLGQKSVSLTVPPSSRSSRVTPLHQWFLFVLIWLLDLEK